MKPSRRIDNQSKSILKFCWIISRTKLFQALFFNLVSTANLVILLNMFKSRSFM